MTNNGPATCCVYTKNRFDSMDDNDDNDVLDIEGEEEDITDTIGGIKYLCKSNDTKKILLTSLNPKKNIA